YFCLPLDASLGCLLSVPTRRSSDLVVNRGPLTVTVLEEGRTRIPQRYIISSPIAGQLRRVELRAGDRVQAGETVVAVVEAAPAGDRKSTRLNSSHVKISYAVFCVRK